MNISGREVYHYHIDSESGGGRFAGRFLKMAMGEMKRQKKSGILFLCIGTDRSTGDCLGPLIGYKLNAGRMEHIAVMGTLDRPVHALNLEYCIQKMKTCHSDSIVVAIDAAVGKAEHIGYVTLGRGALKPGLGVRKNLDEVGDLFITGVVGTVDERNLADLQNVRLSVVMKLADYISKSILCSSSVMEYYVDKFNRDKVPF